MDFTIDQGATWNRLCEWKNEDGTPIDVTGYTARMYLKRKVTDTSPLFQLTTENGRIALASNGRITLQISATDTATLTGVYVYDLEMINSSIVTRLLSGKIVISSEVTK